MAGAEQKLCGSGTEGKSQNHSDAGRSKSVISVRPPTPTSLSEVTSLIRTQASIPLALTAICSLAFRIVQWTARRVNLPDVQAGATKNGHRDVERLFGYFCCLYGDDPLSRLP
ncbi:hypothetical protein PM082_014511 [Marasmius tenuissimus]|nr:hypothetical protein PM082_014511 [Marasmius tenuissimus]